MWRIEHDPAADDALAIALELGNPLADGFLQGFGLIDIVEKNLEFIVHESRSLVTWAKATSGRSHAAAVAG